MAEQSEKRPKSILLALCVVTLLGVLIRVHNLSQYKFYPDSYVPLIVARNIAEHGSVVGTLGIGGMTYPDYIGWTRPIYPLLINLANAFANNFSSAAAMVSLLAGIASIPLAYLFVSSALGFRTAGLLGALLLALSYNHAVAGGFILSDTTGIMFLLLLLWLLSRAKPTESGWMRRNDILVGIAFGLSILARYEYAALILPITYLVLRNGLHQYRRLATILVSTCVVLGMAYLMFFRGTGALSVAGSTAGSLVDALAGFDVSGLAGFALSDILIAGFFLVGFIILARNKTYCALTIFSATAIVALAYLYYQTNPNMQRYWTHLIPFMLPFAAHVLYLLVQWWKRAPRVLKISTASVVAVLFIWQGYFAYAGQHSLDGGLWFQKGYEEQAAEMIAPSIPEDALLIVSFPEPYYLVTNRSTYSVADVPPFVFIPDSLDDRTAFIIQDEGMREVFPTFSRFLDEHLQEFKVVEFPIEATFRYGAETRQNTGNVVGYKVNLKELKQMTDNEL